MKRLLIIGGGNFGREVLDWALAVPPVDRDWQVGGFLDSRADILNGFDVPYPNLGDPDSFSFTDNDCFICAVGEPRMKLRYCRQLQSRGTFHQPDPSVGDYRSGLPLGARLHFVSGRDSHQSRDVGRFCDAQRLCDRGA